MNEGVSLRTYAVSSLLPNLEEQQEAATKGRAGASMVKTDE